MYFEVSIRLVRVAPFSATRLSRQARVEENGPVASKVARRRPRLPTFRPASRIGLNCGFLVTMV